MTNFDKCFSKVINIEGGYVNDKDDSGGETYLGISRVNNPYWSGWITIDELKHKYPKNSITGLITHNKVIKDKLLREAKNLYKSKYWDTMSLDEVPKYKICYQLFDTAVNMGLSTAINIAQQLCKMNITGKFSDELLYNLKNL